MSEVKRYYIMESAVGPMRDERLTYTPLVNYKTDVHVVPLVLASDYDALAAECERVRAANLDCVDHFNQAMAARDAALAELAALKGGQEPKWRDHSVNIAKGEKCPQTIETLQAAWGRDQELIEEQRAEIASQKQTINQLRQNKTAKEQ